MFWRIGSTSFIRREQYCKDRKSILSHKPTDTSGANDANKLKFSTITFRYRTTNSTKYTISRLHTTKLVFRDLKFLIKSNTKIIIKNTWKPRLLRENDKMIMDSIIQFTNNKKQRAIINHWRMYFQLLTIAEIVNYKSNYIRTEFMERNETRLYEPKSTLRLPIQNAKFTNIWNMDYLHTEYNWLHQYRH
jgi:hypothetical protein